MTTYMWKWSHVAISPLRNIERLSDSLQSAELQSVFSFLFWFYSWWLYWFGLVSPLSSAQLLATATYLSKNLIPLVARNTNCTQMHVNDANTKIFLQLVSAAPKWRTKKMEKKIEPSLGQICKYKHHMMFLWFLLSVLTYSLYLSGPKGLDRPTDIIISRATLLPWLNI